MKMEIKMKKEKGSMLVLTIISVLILSIMVTGLLNVGTTEIYTTQNFQLKKWAYYLAVQGVEEIRTKIYNTPDAESVSAIVQMPPGDAYTSGGEFQEFFITGSLKDLEEILAGLNTEGIHITQFSGFKPPPMPSMSLGGSTSIKPVVWKVEITSKIRANRRSTYSEIISGVYSVLTVGY